MCCTGCRYELTWGDGAGECSLPSGEKPPIDAMCEINDLHAENAKLRELVEYIHRCYVSGHDWGPYGAPEKQWVEDRMRELGMEVDL